METFARSRVATLIASGATDRGRVRPRNEDCFGIDRGLQLFVVADGMGGHKAGDVAAQIAVDAVMDFVGNRSVSTTWPFGYDEGASPQANLLRTAVQVANANVFEAACASPSCAGMGTTLVAALVRDDVATVAHVGDSRAYAVRRACASQLTVDDSWVAAMLARDPDIDRNVLKRHPMRNALTSVIGSRAAVDVHLVERRLGDDDLLLLTTDGVHGVLDERELVRACELGADVESIAAGLVQAAMDTGSRDNCTAVVARFESQSR